MSDTHYVFFILSRKKDSFSWVRVKSRTHGVLLIFSDSAAFLIKASISSGVIFLVGISHLLYCGVKLSY